MTINLVTSSTTTSSSASASPAATDVNNKASTGISSEQGTTTTAAGGSRFARHLSMENNDVLVLRSNGTCPPSPTTPPHSHTNSPFIRGAYQSNSINFGSLARRVPHVVPVGMRMNSTAAGNLSPHLNVMPHAHVGSSGGHLHGHYHHYHYHHLHSVSSPSSPASAAQSGQAAAHTHTANASGSVGDQKAASFTVIDESVGCNNSPSHVLVKTPENSRFSSHHRHSIRRIAGSKTSSSSNSPQRSHHAPRTISPTPSTVGTDSVWYEYGCV